MRAAPRVGRSVASDSAATFLRRQAALMWEWRPTRLAILRRTLLSAIVAALALGLTAAALPGLTIDGPLALGLAALGLLALDSGSALVLHWLLVRWSALVAQMLGLAVQFVVIALLARIVPGVHVTDPTTTLLAAVLLTLLNSLFAELVAVSDDDSYYSVLVRRLVARNGPPPADRTAGLLVVQIDGLGLPVLHGALRAGRVPHLGHLLRSGGATLRPWIAELPPTTPASQAGILHGRNDGIVGFRWFEKATGRLMVANHPDDAAEIVRRLSDGHGLLAGDGASIGNLLTGDAPRSYLTMASIAEQAPPNDARRLRGFFVSTVNYVRLLVLMVGEVAKELYQAERQRGRAVEPRLGRGLRYAFERAVTNIALRTVSTALVIEEMYGGAPIIYVDYTGYDTIAHHSGPERPEAIDALEGLDRAIGTLRKAGRHAPRDYRLVVLSDHGQSLGPTFRQRFGGSLEAVVAATLPAGTTVLGTTGAVESGGTGWRLMAEFGQGSGLAPLLARYLPRVLGLTRAARTARTARTAPARSAPDVVVCASGNLAHVYFAAHPGRLTEAAIEAAWPGLVTGLAGHPGIGALVVRSAAGQPLVKGRDDDPLAPYGPRAAAELARLEAFADAGDLILLGAVDSGSGEVTGLEELVGSHGGLGGWQSEAFILFPSTLTLADDPPLGAPALYRQLTAWRAELTGS